MWPSVSCFWASRRDLLQTIEPGLQCLGLMDTARPRLLLQDTGRALSGPTVQLSHLGVHQKPWSLPHAG